MTAVRVAGYLAVAGAIGFFLVAAVGLSERQTIVPDLLRGSRLNTPLGPESRVGSRDPAAGTVTMVGEPDYWDVVLPPFSAYADLIVTYRKPEGFADPKLGVVGAGDSFSLHALEPVARSGDMTAARVSLDLGGVPKRDGAYRMFLSMPGADAAHPLTVGTVTISARRPTLAFAFASAIARLSARLRQL